MNRQHLLQPGHAPMTPKKASEKYQTGSNED